MASAFSTKSILINLLKVYNQSGVEKFISEFIIRWLKKHNIDFTIDTAGNIYNFNHPNAPFLNAHLDSVQRESDKLAGVNLKMSNDLIIKSEGHVIGGDDLVGVYIILYLLGHTDLRFNWILTVSEEIGGIGSTAFVNENSKLLLDSAYGIVIDRRGKEDIICSKNNYGTLDFEQKLAHVGKDFKFSPNSGTWCDADKWRSFVSCANLSCGYYEAHTSNEYVKLTEVFNTINYIKAILSTIRDKFEKPKVYVHTSYGDYDSLYEDDWGHNYRGKLYGTGYQRRSRNGIIDEYEVLEEEEDFEGKCVCCGKEENYISDYYPHTYIETLHGYVCDSCLFEIYDEIEPKIKKLYYC